MEKSDLVGSFLDWNRKELKSMALGMTCSSNVNRPNGELGLGSVRYTRSFSFGRKRIFISNNMDVDATVTTPTKKQCNEILNSEKSLLEALPRDILIRILCGVNHDDLKQLFHVSKSIREAVSLDCLGIKKFFYQIILASLMIIDLFCVSMNHQTLIAKQWHFAYSTPTKTSAFRSSIDLEDPSDLDEVEAPNAPKQSRCYRSRVGRKKMANISVALFATPDEERWPRKDLFMEMETEI
ncbi:hypothetical protein F0562_019013 [Nyssa sinensis]|uniref:F-box domain-containing protein n=1 Tax=Nyssa sinensis TaxID=561372 RepID=A0A5J4ZCD3_9ASTE|nr:hypothetical protein F0562_019013 [Nyssa sinensis]